MNLHHEIEKIVPWIAEDLNLAMPGIRGTVELIEDGSTVPFIARYRKERTGNLDEQRIEDIQNRFEYYSDLLSRKKTVLGTIADQGKLTIDLERTIAAIRDKTTLEDLYLPFKPKKRSKATIAIEQGLQKLADLLWVGVPGTPLAIATPFCSAEVATQDDALLGAKAIMIERLCELSEARSYIREQLLQHGLLVTKVKRGKASEQCKFKDYYDFSEPIRRMPSHRLLAVRRGSEEILNWNIEIDPQPLHAWLLGFLPNRLPQFSQLLETVASEAMNKLLISLSKEVFKVRMEEAELEAIGIFGKNLNNLLLSPPAGQRVILGIDPGYRTGCKCAVIDQEGNLLAFETIYPTAPRSDISGATAILLPLIKRLEVELVAIGNGTGSRETLSFIKSMIARNGLSCVATTVNEAGASVYSASDLARQEFPELDLTVRGAISIARRLQDPLSELVKVEPKAIGVGQYQHDLDQKLLRQHLERIVTSCVSRVGVELNTASIELLGYVAGLNSKTAERIVVHRKEHGPFKRRSDLLSVSGLGPKSFEQCAGFLRIRNGEDPLDNSAIHPEAYSLVRRIAKVMNTEVARLIGKETLFDRITSETFVDERFGIYTVSDILTELSKPGRDPRKNFAPVRFSDTVQAIEDLKPEMTLEGIVTNVTAFGAFVDIGVHQDGLVHISKLSKSYVRDPHAVVAPGDTVRVRVLSVEIERKRISLERLE